MKILVSKDDDLLYVDLIRFLYEISLIRGPHAVSGTLTKHPNIKRFLNNKLKEQLEEVESEYFMPDGTLNLDALQELNSKYRVDKNTIVN